LAAVIKGEKREEKVHDATGEVLSLMATPMPCLGAAKRVNDPITR